MKKTITIAQFSEDGKKWSFGGAAPFKWVRLIEIQKDEDGKVLSRTEGKPQAIKETTRDPAAFGYELE